MTDPSVKGSWGFLHVPALSAPAQKGIIWDFYTEIVLIVSMLQSFSLQGIMRLGGAM